MTASETTSPSTEGHDDRWRALAVCLVAGGMCLLDVSIVNVALPSIRTGLDADDSDLQWVVAGYSLAFGMALVPAGRLGDARSRRTVFMWGVALFTLASAACGAAPSALLLSVARVVQGVGGGLITPQVSGFIQNLFKGPERGRAFGLFGASIGVSTAIGPLLGGLLVQLGGPEIGWRLVFYVNLPIGLLLLVLARAWLPVTERGPRQSLDPVGVVLFATSMLLVLLPVVEGGQGAPLSQRPWWLLGVAALLLVAFVLWERRWAARGNETLVDLRLARVPSYVFGLGLGTCYFAGFTAIFIVLTLYLQQGLGYSALEAGLSQLPFAVGSAVTAFYGGRIVQRYGRVLVLVGLLAVVVGLLGVDLLVPHLDGQVGLRLAPLLLLAGAGGGLVIAPNITLALDEVEPARAGAGGGLLQTAQRVGGAIGVAVVLAQFFAVVGSGGEYAEAVSVSLRTTVGLVVLALLLGLVDLARRVRSDEVGVAPGAGAGR
ncbi:drug resistance transporter, EmrB/QacA subfamily [Nocardioides scoriae]|uniref:Drug resistance transporter, EmrB/QacA subfamily n=1 Tax=Nocardioides scoriae TaxID=642780 RepID=A0A1H1LZJ9_9ACTN|nr:MFS transporter [Nocardioides scoriae]SDR79495.1 drug resistance transporter, EmrB/QacA subfamily [Nocardioides scoriae]